MCEPHHSIIQLSDDDTKGMFLGNVGKWCKKIGKFFHLSKMGKGHHGTLRMAERANRGQKIEFADKYDYEVCWWDRTISPDYCLPPENAKKLAKSYADLTSIGSLHLLRQFLEASLRSTRTPNDYLLVFRRYLLNNKGKKEFDRACRQKLKVQNIYQLKKINSSIVKMVLGFTRKRDLLVPEWSDDSRLWLPSKKITT